MEAYTTRTYFNRILKKRKEYDQVLLHFITQKTHS